MRRFTLACLLAASVLLTACSTLNALGAGSVSTAGCPASASVFPSLEPHAPSNAQARSSALVERIE
jgi:ABC-type oligopeptide transport system substrate-binding subunit